MLQYDLILLYVRIPFRLLVAGFIYRLMTVKHTLYNKQLILNFFVKLNIECVFCEINIKILILVYSIVILTIFVKTNSTN